MSYGDAKNAAGRTLGKAAAFFIGPKLSRDPAAQAAMEWLYQDCGAQTQDWLMLLCYDPTVDTGSVGDLPRVKLFSDLGVVYARNSWKDDAPVLMFKCGPYGGFKLNAYRHAFEKPHYINVAHDDPDANSFALCVDGGFAPHPSAYDNPKLTSDHNTLLVNGDGQKGEGTGWMQPIPDTDMRALSYLTGWKKGNNGGFIIEGEAGNAYEKLKRFRRALACTRDGDLIIEMTRADVAPAGE